MYSNYFTEIIPYAGYDIKQIAWHECMACGNGHIGVLTSGAPKNDSFNAIRRAKMCSRRSNRTA